MPPVDAPRIESDRGKGAAVYHLGGNQIGTIKRVMIEKISGRVAYAALSFGGLLGVGSGEKCHPMEHARLRHRTGGLPNRHQ